MELAKILVNQTTGHCMVRRRIPAGLVGGTVSVEFDDPIWDRLVKTVVFRGTEVRAAEFDGKTAVIPWEVLEHPGPYLFFGIWGSDPESALQLPLIEVRIGQIEDATDPTADPGTDPTLPIWAQLQQDVEQLKQGGGASGEKEIFPAIYGETTIDELWKAAQAGKTCLVKQGNFHFQSVSVTASRAIFSGNINGTLATILCNSDGWSRTNVSLEESISDKSTNLQYPTAKAVYDYVSQHAGGSGAGTFEVTVLENENDGTVTTSATAAEIYAAKQAGKIVTCKYQTFVNGDVCTMPLVYSQNQLAIFSGSLGSLVYTAIIQGAAAEAVKFEMATKGDLAGLIEQANELYQPKGNYLTKVPDGYAKTSDIPTEPADIGAEPAGTAETAVSRHNTDTASHNDIRQELIAINKRLTAFFDSDDQTLDELSEIVAYITSNKTLIDSITTSKVSVSDIIDNLTTNVKNKPLSAAQGVVLKGLIDAVSNSLANYQPKGDYALRSELPAVPTKVSAFTNDAGYLTIDTLPVYNGEVESV